MPLPAPDCFLRLREDRDLHRKQSTWRYCGAGGVPTWEDGLQRGIRVKTSSFTRHPVNVTMPREAGLLRQLRSSGNLKPLAQATTKHCSSTPTVFVAEGWRRTSSGRPMNPKSPLPHCQHQPQLDDPGCRGEFDAMISSASPATTSILLTKPFHCVPPWLGSLPSANSMDEIG